MLRVWPVLLLAALLGQQTQTLHITVAVNEHPVVRHALLISDDPVTAAPRRVVTNTSGAVDVRLRPGRYTIDSDEPFNTGGKAYQWSQQVTVAAGQDATLALTAANADISAATAESAQGVDFQSLFEQWQGSVFTVWSATSYGLGFLVDERGLILTTQRIVGSRGGVQVEVSPTLKVDARTIQDDLGKILAVVQVNPAAVAGIKPVTLGYGWTGTGPVFGVGSVLHGRKFMTTGAVTGRKAGAIDSDIIVDPGNSGAPVFDADAQAIGITTLGPRRIEGPAISGVIGIDAAKSMVAEAKAKLDAATAGQSKGVPAASPLPFEPKGQVREAALKEVTARRSPAVIDYQMSFADFDVTFVTPVSLYFLADRAERGTSPFDVFENWADYVAAYPPVFMIRATPKMAEGFWSVVGRQAAQTQGIQLPPGAKHPKAPFGSLRLTCGDTEITPIHPFQIEHRLDTSDAVYEGFYVYDPASIASCSGVKLTVFKVPAAGTSGETLAVPQKTLDRLKQDFADAIR